MYAMSYRVVLHRAAVAEIRKLPSQVKNRVKSAIDGLADEPVPSGAIRLKGRPNAYRLRIGDHRILYEVHATELVIYVVGVGHRREVYLRLLRRR